MASWNETSNAGFKFEDFCLADISEKKYPLAYKNMNKDDMSYFDIILFEGKFSCSSAQRTIECKFDEKAYETGNICIEVGCNGRLSGLLLTKADYWLIGDGKEMFLIWKSNITDCILENGDKIQLKKKYPVAQEDGFIKEMDFYLIPKSIFRKYCLEVNVMSGMTYEKMI